MIRKIFYRFCFLSPAIQKKKGSPLIDHLFGQKQLTAYLNQTLSSHFKEEVDHKRVVLSFMQIIGSEGVPKSLVTLMSYFISKYNLSSLLNSNLITERILARGNEIIDILPELFLMLSQSKVANHNMISFQNTILSVLPQDLSNMRAEFLIALLSQTLALNDPSEPLVINLSKGLESKVRKLDKYDILDFVEIYKYGKGVAKSEMTQLFSAFEARLIETIKVFNHKEFVQLIKGLKFRLELNEQLLKVLERKALAESNNFPAKDIFVVLDFFRTFIHSDQNKLILQLLLEFAKQKLYRVVRKLDNSVFAQLDKDVLLQDLLTLSISSYESSFFNTYSLLPRQITEEAKAKLSDPVVEKRLLEQLKKAKPSNCLSYLFISLEAQLLNEEIITIIEEKIVTDQKFTSLHLEAFCKMAKAKYLPDIEKWSPLIESFLEANKTQHSSDDVYNGLISSIIMILEGQTKFEKIYLSLTNIMLDKKVRLNTFQKFELLRISCFIPNYFTLSVANFLLEELSQSTPNEIRIFELEDKLARIVLSLEALFSKDNLNPIIIKGYNYDPKNFESMKLNLYLPKRLIPVWKKSEAIYRANFIKRKPLYQFSLLEDNVINALIGFMKNKGQTLSGGHYVHGFEVDIVVLFDNKIIVVEVNGKSHYYLNKKDKETWRTKGKEIFFKNTNIPFISIGMTEWNLYVHKKKEFIFELFKKNKLLSDFTIDKEEKD